MFENKKFNLIISFIIAFALWFYVVGLTNPPTKKTYRNIPIMLTNEQTLNDNGRAVLNASDDSMRVTISGNRNVVSKLSKSDIVATCDLTDAAEGSNKLSIDLKIPENVEIDNQSINEITVNVEARITKTKDVRVSYEGTTESGQEPAIVKIDPETVQVSGAKSIVDKVSYVKAVVDSSEITQDLSSTTSALTAVSASGRQIDNVNLSDTKCKITSILYKTKTVRLNVPIKDNSKDDLTRSTSYPQKITIKGPASEIAGITEVSCASVDITNLKENQKIQLSPILPDDIQVADKDKDIALTVKVSKAKQKQLKAKNIKSFTFTEDDVVIDNAGDTGYNISQESIEVQITGTEEQLETIRSSDIVLRIDAAGHEENSFEADIHAECLKTCSEIAVIPSRVAVTKN